MVTAVVALLTGLFFAAMYKATQAARRQEYTADEATFDRIVDEKWFPEEAAADNMKEQEDDGE